MSTKKQRDLLETFENQFPQRDYEIRIEIPEFTSVCPKTGQPDFGTIIVEYVPDKLCLELKALKYYFQSYRSEGIFYESLVNTVLDDLAKVCKPRHMTITGDFTPRGGISSIVAASL